MTIKKSRLAVVAAIPLAIALATSGCSVLVPGAKTGSSSQGSGSNSTSGDQAQSAKLDAYVAAAQPQIQQLEKTNAKTYSSVKVRAVHPGTLAYAFTYVKQIDGDAASKYFDKSLDSLQGVLDEQVFPDMKKAGITSSVHAVYTYYNADGKKIWDHTFSPSK